MPEMPKRMDYYIKLVIKQSCEAEGKKNDVRMWYRLMDDEVLFAIKTGHPRVMQRILYRLKYNLPKKFNLKLCIVIPDHPTNPLWDDQSFDIYSMDQGVDPNHSICTWRIDNKLYTIRSFFGIHGLVGEPHLIKLKEHGYDYIENKKDWKIFSDAFVAAYGVTPLEANMAYRKKLKEEKK